MSVLGQLTGLAVSLGARGEVFAALLTICFASMARISSLLPARVADFDQTRLPVLGDLVETQGHTLQLRLKWAKNLQEADGAFWVPLVNRTELAVCPVWHAKGLRRRLANLPAHSPLFSFPANGGAGRITRGTVACFTMRVARQWLGVLLGAIGRGNEGFTFHSLRRGACTLAFRNGADEAALRALGGWRSEAVRGYYDARDARNRAAAALSGAETLTFT